MVEAASLKQYIYIYEQWTNIVKDKKQERIGYPSWLGLVDMASLSVVGLKENIGGGRNLAAASTIVKLP
jgi:hypothetical protein